MTIAQYKILARENRFTEYPDSLNGLETSLKDFLDFGEADHDLKIYLVQMVLCRCCTVDMTCLPKDYDWLITAFLRDYKADPVKSWMKDPISEAIGMVTDEEALFTKGIIGTTFLFGIIEFWVKYHLGYRPNQYDFFDRDGHKKFRMMSVGKALEQLQKQQLPIAKLLNAVDQHHIDRMKRNGREDSRFAKTLIRDRLSLYRNTMLHGESHAFYDVGIYLALLYMLFYYQHEKESSPFARLFTSGT